MLGLKVSKDDLVIGEVNGLSDLVLTQGVETTSNLVRTRIITQYNKNAMYQPLNTIDWIELLEMLSDHSNSSKVASIAFTKLRMLVDDTDGVDTSNVDDSYFEASSNGLFLTNVCFTHECGLKESVEL